jgi:non-specific serine/threonine protein kinase
LQRHLTSFVGRERELAEVSRLLAQAAAGSRLVTLTGPGGCGKTRLALRVADDFGGAYAEGVAIVELAPLADPSLTPQFIASALGVRDVPGRPIITTLIEHLRPLEALLVLDNCEHLVDSCAALVEGLLLSCPGLCILATSREMLGVPGEIAWAVPALSTPNPEALPSHAAALVAEVLRSEAVRLFVDRARLVTPGFEVTPRNARMLARICWRLDGMPLPIELAAARARLLSPEQIEDRLNDCFEVLAAGSRAVTSRHRTLWATIDWSYGLLDESERALLRGLSVFAGGFTLETAEAVCSASLELLGHLVDKSLVVVEQPTPHAMRYRLLETIRQYSREKLRASGGLPNARRAHARYFLELAETAEPGLTGPERVTWLARLAAEHDNLRAALDWTHEEGGEIEVGLRLVGALWWFWNLRDHLSEGSARAEAVLAHPDANQPTLVRARALTSAGAIAWLMAEYGRAIARLRAAVEIGRSVGERRELAYALTLLALAELRANDRTAATEDAEESVALFRGADDPWGLAWALNNLGYIAGDSTGASVHLTESLERFRRLGDRWGIALPLSNLGHLACQVGDYTRARAQLEESVAIFRELDHFWVIPRTLNSLGNVVRCMGESARAASLFEESLELCRAHGDQAGVAIALSDLANVARDEGELQHAAELYRQALSIFHVLGRQRGVRECLAGLAGILARSGLAENGNRLLAAAQPNRQTLNHDGDVTLEPGWKSGDSLTLDDAVEMALRIDPTELRSVDPPVATAEQSVSPLTQREQEVAALIGRGFSNRQIGEALVISERTAESHVSHILARLELTSRAQIGAWAVERGARRRDH